MALESRFEIKITGNKLFGRDLDKLKLKIESFVRKLDPKFRANEYIFMDRGYRIILTGEPVFFDVIDLIQRKIRTYTEVYLTKWKVSIIINLKETY